MPDPCFTLDCAPKTFVPLVCAPCCSPPPPPTPCILTCPYCAAMPSAWSFSLDALEDVFAVFNGEWVVTSLCAGDGSGECLVCRYTYDDGTVSWDLEVVLGEFWVLTGQSGDVVIQYWLPQPQWNCGCPNPMHRITPGNLLISADGFGCTADVHGCGLAELNGLYTLASVAPKGNRNFPCHFEDNATAVWGVTLNPDGSVSATGFAVTTSLCLATYSGPAPVSYCDPFTLDFTGVSGTNFAIGDPVATDGETGLHCFEDSTYPPSITVTPHCTAFNPPELLAPPGPGHPGGLYSLIELIDPPIGQFPENFVTTDCVAGVIYDRPPEADVVTLTPVDCTSIEDTYCLCCACDDATGGDEGGAAPRYNLTVPPVGDPCADEFAGDFVGIGGLFVTDSANFPCRWQALDPENSARVLWTLLFTGTCGDPVLFEWTLFTGGDLASAKLIYKNKVGPGGDPSLLFSCLPGGEMHLAEKTCDDANPTLTLDMGPCGPLPGCGTIAVACCPGVLFPQTLRWIFPPTNFCGETITLEHSLDGSGNDQWIGDPAIAYGNCNGGEIGIACINPTTAPQWVVIWGGSILVIFTIISCQPLLFQFHVDANVCGCFNEDDPGGTDLLITIMR